VYSDHDIRSNYNLRDTSIDTHDEGYDIGHGMMRDDSRSHLNHPDDTSELVWAGLVWPTSLVVICSGLSAVWAIGIGATIPVKRQALRGISCSG
jgi:hypothetical protein